VVDEYFGEKQFEVLCKENKNVQISPKASGKTVYLQRTKRTEISQTWVPIVLTSWRYVDLETEEVVLSYNTLQALGGRFTRGLSEGGVPQTFAGYCDPPSRPVGAKAFKELGMNLIDRPANK
jgi:hypothetical protein